MFSKIVPAFSIENIATLGPLFLVAFVYEGLGLLLAWTVKQFFWVPHRFRHGIVMAGGWSNYADLRKPRHDCNGRSLTDVLALLHSHSGSHEHNFWSSVQLSYGSDSRCCLRIRIHLHIFLHPLPSWW